MASSACTEPECTWLVLPLRVTCSPTTASAAPLICWLLPLYRSTALGPAGCEIDDVFVIPGNHDVSACHTMDSARRIDLAAGQKRELVEQLFTTNSPLRWSWPDFELYEIADQSMYARRLGIEQLA